MPIETHTTRPEDRLTARAPVMPTTTDQTPDTDQPGDSTADLADEFESGSLEGGEIAAADVTLTTFDDGSEVDMDIEQQAAPFTDGDDESTADGSGS